MKVNALDFNKISKLIEDLADISWNKYINDDSTTLVMSSEIEASSVYDDGILVELTVLSNRVLIIDFTFDALTLTLKVYQLIDSFNGKSPWFKAYLKPTDDGKFFLTLKYLAPSFIDEKDCADLVNHALNTLIDDKHAALLKELTLLTN